VLRFAEAVTDQVGQVVALLPTEPVDAGSTSNVGQAMNESNTCVVYMERDPIASASELTTMELTSITFLKLDCQISGRGRIRRSSKIW
jgi:hypothetical protein